MMNRLMMGAALAVMLAAPSVTEACTGITLTGQNGDVCYGRTMEWGAFDMESRILVYPRNHQFQAKAPAMMKWTGKLGIVGLDLLEKGYLADAINENGLTGGLFYHPDFADYAPFDPAKADRTLGPLDVLQYTLSTCSTVKDVREALTKVEVAPIFEDVIHMAPQVHFLFTDPSGDQVVVEWENQKIKFYDAPLGVITNAPRYDWHMTNLRNYIKMSSEPAPDQTLKKVKLAQLGNGSGMLGLPGDFTPPSRFVRASEFSATARNTPDGAETIYEMFRILDNFNLPIGAGEGSLPPRLKGMRSSTLWTTSYDLNARKLYYHTQNNRTVQMVDLKKIDFAKLDKVLASPLDIKKEQLILDRTPQP